MGCLDALLNFIQLLAMKYVVAFLVQGLFAFAQAPGQGRPSSADATTRLLIEFFKGDKNRDGRISEGEFGWPKVMFGPMDQNRDGFITANEVQSLLPRASNTRRYNPSAPQQNRQTMRLTQTQLASLPDITHFATHKSDQFLVNMDVISAGHPYLGKNFYRPHTGCHIYFKQPGKEATPQKPSSYAPIYAVADGFITSVTPCSNCAPSMILALKK